MKPSLIRQRAVVLFAASMVASVAFALGGGGHKAAAGATVEGTLDEVKARVLPMLEAAIQQGQQVSV